MFKSKAIITLVVIIAVAVFVVAAVSSVMTGGGENYQRPAAMQDSSANDMETVEQDSEDSAASSDDAVDDITGSDTDPEMNNAPLDETVSTETSEEAEQVAEREAQALESNATNDSVEAMTAAVDSATEAALDASEDVKRKANAAILAATEEAKGGRQEAEDMVDEASSTAEEVVSPDEPVESKQSAQTHTVTAQGLVYNPLVVKIQPGDTVAWRNMSTHDTQSLEGLIPGGTEMWHSPMSENYRRIFEQEGIYVYKCTPHFGAGMGGAIIVGEPVNLDQIKQVDAKGATKRLVNKAIQEAENM